MPIIDLGTKNLYTGADWVSFNPIVLNNGVVYPILLNFSSQEPSLVYSRFYFRCQLTLNNLQVVHLNLPGSFFFSLQKQMFELILRTYSSNSLNVTLQAKRFASMQALSKQIDVKINLQIDPTVNSKL